MSLNKYVDEKIQLAQLVLNQVSHGLTKSYFEGQLDVLKQIKEKLSVVEAHREEISP